MRVAISAIVVLIALPGPPASHADSMTVRGERYDDILINESSVFYYLSFPEQGTVLNVPKADVDPASVARTQDPQIRAALRLRWKAARAKRATQSGVVLELHAESPAADLKAVAAALQDSKPPPSRKLKHHNDPEQGPPVFYLKGDRKSDPLRRAEIRANVARMRQSASSSTAAGQGLGIGGAPSGGGSGSGGGGNGGGGGDARATFSNISDLFGTIDDRSVGERPSPFN